MNPEDPNLFKIADAARYLGVARRTIYRRIWNGDLPASKVGGLYFIRKADLEALLIRGRAKPAQKEAESKTSLKCKACFRVLESEEQIAELCAAEGCENLICDRCWAEDIRHCFKHMPDKSHQQAQAIRAYQQGQLPVFVTGARARLQEVNFIQRIQTRVEQIDTFIHPQTEEVITVSEMDAYRNQGDERTTLMRLMGKMILDKSTTVRLPLNAWVCWDLPAGKSQQGPPLRIQAQVLGRLPEMLRNGFDTNPLGEDELSQRLIKLGDIAQTDQVVNLVVLAASSGWDEPARMAIQGQVAGAAFAHQNLLVYLFDMPAGELIYNLNDVRLGGFADLFAPLLPEEEISEAISLIEEQFVTYDSLSLAQALQSLPYDEQVIEKAFQRLAEAGEYAITTVPDIGAALVKK